MIRAFQWDLARQVERLDWLLKKLPHYAAWGYQELHLHLEDAIDYPSLPGVARADAYSWKEFERLVKAAADEGIKVVPIANLLGHTQYLIKTEEWRDLNELRAPDGSPEPIGQICPLHARSTEVARRIIADLAPLCTGEKIHLGLDESFHLGKHPDSKREIEKIGLARHFAKWTQTLTKIADQHGLKSAIWADMLIMLPEAIPHLPSEIHAYDWYYHPFRTSPRFELYNFSEYDLHPPLEEHGIKYWACPMNGAFRHEPLPVFGERLANAVSWWNRAKKVNATGYLVSSWEASHLTPETTTVVDAAIASLWLDGDATDAPTLLKRGFERVAGTGTAANNARLAMACDERAFAGYARAERHQNWDTSLLLEGVSPAAAEARFFNRATTRTDWSPFRISLQWRQYLAQRETFTREMSHAIFRGRRLLARKKFEILQRALADMEAKTDAFETTLKEGAIAARNLWKSSRTPNPRGANSAIVASDRKRMRAWKTWLAKTLKNPDHLMTASVMTGRWQLQFYIHAIRPAANLVVVQQQEGNGKWRDIRQRHTIEFRSGAARRTSQLKRGWSVPIEDASLPIRIALRGVGEIAIGSVQLSNGIETRRNRSWPRGQRRKLGKPAPTSGWPELEWSTNRDELELAF